MSEERNLIKERPEEVNLIKEGEIVATVVQLDKDMNNRNIASSKYEGQ